MAESQEANLPNLLVIDDSELIHRLLRARLHNERVQLHSAISSKEGLELARTLKPDVILLDLDMPDMDGFAVIERLKEDPATQNIAVIFVSASNDLANQVRGLDLGAVDFIAKPFEVVELKARLRSALRVQHLIKILAQKAQIDGASGLWNHTYFDQRLSAEISEATRYSKPLSLIIVDLDHFKSTNDQFGHLFGDLVIERFANILNSGRTSDVACRYGGEEFGVILPQTTAAEACEVAERWRSQLSSTTWQDHSGLVLTASFGVCDLESLDTPRTPARLVAAADHAMYTAKKYGRNRVEVFAPTVARK